MHCISDKECKQMKWGHNGIFHLCSGIDVNKRFSTKVKMDLHSGNLLIMYPTGLTNFWQFPKSQSVLVFLCCSARCPVGMGSSPEQWPAWALGGSPSAQWSALLFPSPSPSRAATWATARLRSPCCSPKRAAWRIQSQARAHSLRQQLQLRPRPPLLCYPPPHPVSTDTQPDTHLSRINIKPNH